MEKYCKKNWTQCFQFYLFMKAAAPSKLLLQSKTFNKLHILFFSYSRTLCYPTNILDKEDIMNTYNLTTDVNDGSVLFTTPPILCPRPDWMITLGMAQSFAPNELEQDSNDNVWFACFFVNGRASELHYLGMNGFLLFFLYQRIERCEVE